MKTNSPTIRLVLRTNKTLSNGTNPIMLRVQWKGLKERSTGYSCRPSDWNEKRECLNRTYPNAAAINLELVKLKNEFVERVASLEALGEDFSLDDIFSTSKEKTSGKAYSSLYRAYMDAMQLKYTTRLNHKATYLSLCKFFGKDDFEIGDITETTMRAYERWLTVSDGSKRQRLGEIGAVYTYAVEKGLALAKNHPFKNWKWSRKLRKAHSTLYIHKRSMDFVRDYLLEKIVVRNGSMWNYTENAEDVFTRIWTRDFAILIYYTMYLLQGLAPKDMALLKRKDVKTVLVNGDLYYSIDTVRTKTNVQVKIRRKKEGVDLMIIGGFLLFGSGEYFLPILENLGTNVDERVRNVGKYVNKYLRHHWQRINERIIKHNVENNDTVPLIDKECTLYSARHSFAMAYISNPSATPIALGTLMGRSMNTLGSYLQELSEESDLIDAASLV